jgi:phosphatidylserine decarboxylase
MSTAPPREDDSSAAVSVAAGSSAGSSDVPQAANERRMIRARRRAGSFFVMQIDPVPAGTLSVTISQRNRAAVAMQDTLAHDAFGISANVTLLLPVTQDHTTFLNEILHR